MPLYVSGAYVIADSRLIKLVDFEIHRNSDGWSALTRFQITDQNENLLEYRKMDYVGSQMAFLKNQLFQSDALDKIYQNFIDNSEFDVPVTGVSNEFEN